MGTITGMSRKQELRRKLLDCKAKGMSKEDAGKFAERLEEHARWLHERGQNEHQLAEWCRQQTESIYAEVPVCP